MSVSEARLAANRENAKRSTGPTSEEGRRRSSLNSLKHGLCSKTVLTDDEAMAQARAEGASDAEGVDDSYRRWLTSQAAVLTARLDRSVTVEKIARDRAALRATLSWDEDRRLDAIRLASKIADGPEEVAERLRGSYHGCEWMIARWAMLAYCAEQKGGWTPEQMSLAFDLLGTPPEFREGHMPGIALDFLGRAGDSPAGPADLARRQVAELMERREVLADLDEADRTVAGSDFGQEDAPDVKLARRYETSLHNRLKWCVAQLKLPTPVGLEDLIPSQPEPVAPAPTPEVGPEPSRSQVEPTVVAERTQDPAAERTQPAAGRTQEAGPGSSRLPLGPSPAGRPPHFPQGASFSLPPYPSES